MKKIAILGSTGSIGQSTLSVVQLHPDKFQVVALTARSQIALLFKQCQQFRPQYAVVQEPTMASKLQEKLAAAQIKTEVLSGELALQQVAVLSEVDMVVAAIVGAAGLLSTLAAAKAGKRILLANKEALVMSGSLLMDTVKSNGAHLLPIDSEHNAIFQCMPDGYISGNKAPGVQKIILTASGGPFRCLPTEQFSTITPKQAVVHPNWQMGAKISVDSATMMNKGLEVIEAHWLFNLAIENIEVLIHPQSIVHSFVSYADGSMLAQLGQPDMRTPISYALSWPDRMASGVSELDLLKASPLTFEPVDSVKFPALNLAYSALKAGGTAPAILNAANEVAVAAFFDNQLRFCDMANIISEVLSLADIKKAVSYEQILLADQWARAAALKAITVTV